MAKPFTTLRWLRNYKSKSGQQVFVRVRVPHEFETEIPVYDYVNHRRVPIKIHRNNWDKGYVTGGHYHISIRDLNFLLRKVEDNVIDAVRELMDKKVKLNRDSIIRLTYINEENAEENERKIASGEIIVDHDGGAFASHAEFEDFIAESEDPKFNPLKKKMGIYEKIYILDYWDDFISDFAPASYNAVRHAIEEYVDVTKDYCKVSEFSSNWLERFFKHIIKNGYSLRKDGKNRKKYTISTVKKYHKILLHFGKYLFEELKLIDNQDYKRHKLRKPSKKQSLIKYNPEAFINTHALYKKEFDWFYAYKFETKLHETVRDMFVLQTWLGGLRERDFYNITKVNFHKDSNGKYKVWFEQRKTNNQVLNIFNQNYLVPLLNKYSDGFDVFPKVHMYNKMLKKAAGEAGLTRKLKFRFEYAQDEAPTIEWMPIYEKISNDWARNCAVSILAEAGYPDDRISKFIGHQDLEMIRHYKNIHQKDISTMMDEVKPEEVTVL